MKYDILIFDVHNLYYRALWKNTNRSTVIDGRTIKTGGIQRSLEMIKRRQEKYLKEGGTMYFLFDNPESRETLKKMISFEYKRNRKNMQPEFYKGLNYLETILKKWTDNGYVIREYKTEADDFVDPIVKNNIDKDILMVSTDMDWSRCLSDKCHWLDKREVYTPYEFEVKYGFYPTRSSVCFYKTFYGDRIDNIEGVLTQLGLTYFKMIIERYTDIYDFIYDAINNKIDFLDEGWKIRIALDRKKLTTNWKLVDFVGLDNVDLERHSTKCKLQKEKLNIIYTALGFEPSEIDNRLTKDINVVNLFGKGDR